MNHPFFTSGFTTINNKITFDDSESVALTLVWNFANVSGCTWNFYNSSTGTLISSTTGKTPVVSFTTAQGKDGIDIELIISYALYQTKFFKKHRLVVIPDTSSPDFTINLSDGLSDPYINDEGSGQHNIDFSMCSGGEVVRLMGSISSVRIKFINLPSAVSNPVILVVNSAVTITKTGATYDEVIRIDDGDPTNGFWMVGKLDGSGNKYFNIVNGGITTYRSTNVNSHNNLRFTGIKFSTAQSSGLKVKLDVVDRFHGACDDVWNYQNEFDSPVNEAYYFGWEAASGHRYDATFNGGDYHHLMSNAVIFANWSHDCGWDGGQLTGGFNAQIHDNLFENNGTSDTFAQDFSLTCGSGFSGQIYNNIFDRHIQVFASGDTWIYNNYLPGHVDAGVNNAIFIRRYDNPGYLGVNSDSYDHSDPTGRLFVFNNIITSIQDPIYILDGNDDATGTVPLAEITIVNNTFNWTGAAAESLGLRYNEGTTATLDNLIASSRAAIAVVDEDNQDVSLTATSEVFYAANEGIDLTTEIDPDDLAVGLTDLSGQNYPVNGYFWNAPIQRNSGFVIPSTLETQITWYQTNQASVFSDKEKLSDYSGYKVKITQEILSSAKPLLVGSVKPVALTGTANGVETFDDVSN